MAQPKHDRNTDHKTALYRRFLSELGIETPALPRLFAEEILHLSPEDFAIYKEGNFFAPERWTEERIGVHRTMRAPDAMRYAASCTRASPACRRPHATIAAMIGSRVRPRAVSAYSTRGGISG